MSGLTVINHEGSAIAKTVEVAKVVHVGSVVPTRSTEGSFQLTCAPFHVCQIREEGSFLRL